MAVVIKKRAEKKAEVRRLRAAGVSTRAVSKRLGIAEGTVRKLEAEAEADEDAARLAAPPEPDAAEDAPDGDDGDALAQAKAMLRDARRLAREAARDGNHTAAQRAMRDAGGLATLVARLEKQASGVGGIVVTPEALRAAEDAIKERFKALAQRPLCCSKCGAALTFERVVGRPSEPGEIE